ncbi:MAG: hypothetical protein K0Q57_929 [Gammaproteobacteria bacterium]|jgi:hypothetical protein|nr:hypothetical protein [Gammaproteobacteria bacterium]
MFKAKEAQAIKSQSGYGTAPEQKAEAKPASSGGFFAALSGAVSGMVPSAEKKAERTSVTGATKGGYGAIPEAPSAPAKPLTGRPSLAFTGFASSSTKPSYKGFGKD